MKTLEGIAGIPGKVSGKAFVYERTLVASPDRAAQDLVAEINLLRASVERASADLTELETAVRQGPIPETAAIFRAILSVLEDDAFIGDAVHRIESDGDSALAAIAGSSERFAEIFSRIDDPVHRQQAGAFYEASMIVSRLLAGKPTSPWPELPGDSVVIARNLTLLEMATAPTDRMAGIILAEGAGESALLDLARRLGLPIGLGFGSALEGLRTGDKVTLEVSEKAIVWVGCGDGSEKSCGESDGLGANGGAIDDANGDVTPKSAKGDPHSPVTTSDGRTIMVRVEAPWGSSWPSTPAETVWILPPDFDPDQANLPRLRPGYGPHLVLSIGDEVNLTARSRRFPSGYRIGAVVERPGLAAAADLVARQADFLYLNPGVLGRACGGILHPGTLRLIQHVVRSASKAGTPVQIGGEAAADPILLPLWLGLEITEWSLPEQALRDFRAHIRIIPWAWAREVGVAALRLSKAEDIGKYLEDAIGSRKSLRGLLRSSSGS